LENGRVKLLVVDETDGRLPCGLKLFLRENIPMPGVGGIAAVDLVHANRYRTAARSGGVRPSTLTTGQYTLLLRSVQPEICFGWISLQLDHSLSRVLMKRFQHLVHARSDR
jgi:hypothetical protein